MAPEDVLAFAGQKTIRRFVTRTSITGEQLELNLHFSRDVERIDVLIIEIVERNGRAARIGWASAAGGQDEY